MSKITDFFKTLFAPTITITKTTYINGEITDLPPEFERAFEKMNEAFHEMNEGLDKLRK